MVVQLLAAGAALDLKNEVRGEGGADRGGPGNRTQLCVSFKVFWLGASQFLVIRSLPGLVRALVTIPRCKRGNVADSPTHQLKEISRSCL